MRQYLLRLLGERYEVIAVPDGQAALASIRDRVPDLVLTDVMMPNLDGFGLLRELRANPETRAIPIILLSARAGEESRVEGMEHGADDYLIKPFSARELLARVQTHLAMARIRNEAAELEHALRIDAELLASIVASSDDAIISKNLDGVITSWNKGAEHIFGYTAEEAIGRHITLIIPPDRRSEEHDIIERLRKGERIDHFQTIRARKDGTTLDISATISPIRDSAGRVVGASKVARDISERRRAEEREHQMAAEAIAATAKFRAVFEQTPVFAGIMALDGTVIDANQLSLDACGYRSEDVLGRPFWETPWWRLSPEAQAKIRAACIQAAQGKPFRETLVYHWADGSEHVVDFTLNPIVDSSGEILFLHPTGVDITDLKRAEESYRQLVETLETQVRARTSELESRNLEVLRQSELLREFSQRLLRTQDEERRHIARELHDSAGQTLAVLSMGLDQLVQKVKPTAPELLADTEMIQETVRQLHREMRTTSYLLHPPLLDETGISSALHWYVQGLVERSGLEINLDIPEKLGRLPRDMELVVFRLVQESLTNIHRHSGSKTATIRVLREDGRVTVEIRDQGKGMSPARLAEIQSKGSGVGIRGMRERLRPFEGTMNIESGAAGTRIFVTIPLPKQSCSEEQQQTAAGRGLITA